MSDKLTRRDFFSKASTGCGAVALLGLQPFNVFAVSAAGATRGSVTEEETFPPDFPRQESDVVREVVGASHGRFERVKELVTSRPSLAKASWDWGFGDWESALGAASHTGGREIAEFLMEHGARPNIFTFVMLGKLQAVKSMVEALPGIQRTPGPHGITLLQHGRVRLRRDNLSAADRSGVEEVVHYLESLGDADLTATSLDISEAQQEVFLGSYTFGPAGSDTLNVYRHSRGWLMLQRDSQVGRALNLVAPNTFSPSGAPAVRIRFDVADGLARSVTILDPMPVVTARRIGG